MRHMVRGRTIIRKEVHNEEAVDFHSADSDSACAIIRYQLRLEAAVITKGLVK